MSEENDEVTITEAADELNVSRSSIKRYIYDEPPKLESRLEWRGDQQRRLIPRESIEAFKKRRINQSELDDTDRTVLIDENGSDRMENELLERAQAGSSSYTKPAHSSDIQTLTNALSELLTDAREGLKAVGQVEQLEQENDRLRQRNSELKEQVESVHQEHKELRQELNNLRERVQALERLPLVKRATAVSNFFWSD